MRFNSVAALIGAAAAVQALPAIEEPAHYTNSSIEVPKQQGFEVVIVYVRPAEGCPAKPTHCEAGAPGGHKTYDTPSLPESSIAENHGEFGSKGEKTATAEHDGPIATLTPAVHWGYDTKPATNVIPIAPEKGSEMFYGITDPSKSGHYAFLTYYFNNPSVNLDHCDHISTVKYDSKGLTVSFGSEEAYDHAISTWSAEENIILIVYVPGCGDYAKGDRCYFQVTALSYKKGDLVIIAGGKPCHPDDIISKGETEWGWWTPREDGYGPKAPSTKTLPGIGGQGTTRTATTSTRSTTTARAQTSQLGASFSWGAGSTATVSATTIAGSSTSGAASSAPSGSGSPSSAPGSSSSATGAAPSESSASPSGSGSLSPSGSSPVNSQAPSGTSVPEPGNTSAGFSTPKASCNAPVDTKYGLPSACLGELFDVDLDNDLGYEALSQQYKEFATTWAPGIDDYAELDGEDFDEEFWKTKRGVRVLRKRFCGRLCDIVSDYVVKPVVQTFKAVQQATSISGSINKELTWKLPDASSTDPDAKTLKDPETKQVTSPWGDSILLKAFGNQEGDEEKKLNGYMNVFCVGCGVSGSAKVAGKASWTPIGGFIEGQVDVNTDIQFVLKLGIDAQMTYKQEFSHTLLNVGLPGLSYGVVTIGPRITVGSRVELEAEAKGKLLAGAEMGLQNAHVLIDFVNPSNSKRDGWDPYFKPVFEAEGEIMLAATLGLPIGLRCGLQISSWDKSVGVIDEPSIKGVAQVAASIELTEDNKFAAGFKETDGCTGISTQISWRNKLYIDIFGTQQIPLLDTDDRPLARGCIALPGVPDKEPTATTDPKDPTATPDPAETGAPTDPEDPENPVDPEDPENPTDPESPVDPEDTEGPSDPEDFPEDGSNGDGEDDDSEGDVENSTPEDEDIQDDEDFESDNEDGNEEFEDDVEVTFPILARQATPAPVPATTPTNTTGKVVDLTSKIKGNGTNTLNYTPEALPNRPYNTSAGYELALMVDPEATTMIVSCSNGNMYAFTVEGPDNEHCSEMWAAKNDVLVTDGAQRLMHYYNNTMSSVGVSRVRLDDQENIPSSGVVVAFAPYSADENDDDYFYLAVDPNDDVFYPLVCDYEDGSGSKIFLAKDPEEGATMLMSEDLRYTVTGGKVSGCYPLTLMQGRYADGDDYMSLGETTDSDEWELEDGWFDEE